MHAEPQSFRALLEHGDFRLRWAKGLAAILLLLLAVVIGVVSSGKRVPTDRRAPMLLAPPNPDNEEESAVDLSLHDPVEALLRYGTPDDAARLSEQGVDLKGLGYRPPER